LLSKVRSSATLLVVVGSRWYGHGPAGRLIDDPSDWVRREIATAFDAGVRVLPLLVGEVSTLRYDDLPPDIRRLASLHYLRVRAEDAVRDIPLVVDEAVAVDRNGTGRTSRQDIDRLLLLPDERPRFLAPCRLPGRGSGSAVLLVTDRRLCIADREGEREVRLLFPLTQIVHTEVRRNRWADSAPTADLMIHTSTGSLVVVWSLLLEQAEQVVDVVGG
jgi:hypothetical protein